MTEQTLFAARAAGHRYIFPMELAELPHPPAALLDEARGAELTKPEHDRLAAQIPALSAVEVLRREPSAATGDALTIAAWNAERLKYHEPSVALARATAPDILLISEADLGMARAGNRHTVADLASDLGMSYVYGVEFVELGLGDSREREWHAGQPNTVGFHGNGLVTKLPLKEAALIKLDDGAVWWTDAQDGQGRLGSRMAIAALIEAPFGDIVAVSVHLESKSDAADRARQIARLIEAIDVLAGDLPVVIGGDLNTNVIPAEARDPENHEPLFAAFAAAGYDWDKANDYAITQRTRPDGTPLPPFTRIDWLFSRRLTASEPKTVPAVDDKGDAISDHDLVMARFAPAG